MEALTELTEELVECVFAALRICRAYSQWPAGSVPESLWWIGPTAAKDFRNCFLDDKITSDIADICKHWRRPGNQIPAPLRPIKAQLDWYPYIETSVNVGDGFSIVPLKSWQDLIDEGEALEHCTGRGSYATSCQKGEIHMLSVRQYGIPKGTVTLAKAKGFGSWKKKIFLGKNGSKPTEEENAAWDRFEKLVLAGQIQTCTVSGITDEAKAGIPGLSPAEQFIGFPMKEAAFYIGSIIKFLQERVSTERAYTKRSIGLFSDAVLEELNRNIALLEQHS